MYATIQKWGNSQGLRIPKALLDAVGLKEHDRVELVQMDDGINIRRASSIPHRTLEERLTAFYGKPIDQITGSSPVAGSILAYIHDGADSKRKSQAIFAVVIIWRCSSVG